MSDNPTGVYRVVIDASVAIAFALEDEPHHKQAILLITGLVERNAWLCAPGIFTYECDSVIRRRVYLKTLSPAGADEARALITALSVESTSDLATGERAYQIATEFNQPRTYDASYAAFAEILGLELWTDDKQFYNSVAGANIKRPLSYVRFLGNSEN